MNRDCPICATLAAEPCQPPPAQLHPVAAAEVRPLPDGAPAVLQRRHACVCGAGWLQIDAPHQPFAHWVCCSD